MNKNFDKKNALILTDGFLSKPYAKTAHGLIRYSEKFLIKAILDNHHSGNDAGEILDDSYRNIPVLSSIDEIIDKFSIEWAIVGIAPIGGKMTSTLKKDIIKCLDKGISVISGLHDYLYKNTLINTAAKKSRSKIIDIRKPKSQNKLHAFTGDISKLKTPRIAILGMDCAIGKRTTARLITQAASKKGLKTELIFTGQSGWLQGGKYGFIFDSTLNDFVAGELEHQILSCVKNENPDLIILEGQSGLKNPYGPCGTEFIVSAGAKGIILQIDPSRKYFDGLEVHKLKIGSIEDEIKIINLYGAEVIAITLHTSYLNQKKIEVLKQNLNQNLGIPIIAPLIEDEKTLLKPVNQFLKNYL